VLLSIVLGVLAVTGYSVVHTHLYRVSLFSPDGLPERVPACGRHFAASSAAVVTATRQDVDAASPGREAVRQVGTFAPPFHRRMEVLGRPDEPACGTEVFVGDDGHLARYGLMGGPWPAHRQMSRLPTEIVDSDLSELDSRS
jgi:hypothetical protein